MGCARASLDNVQDLTPSYPQLYGISGKPLYYWFDLQP